MFGNGSHKVLKFFNKPNVYLSVVENQLKGLRKGDYTYGAMLAWQMAFVLSMFSQLRSEACLGGALQRGCAGSFLGQAFERVETETQTKGTKNKDDGLKLTQRHCRDGKSAAGKPHTRWRDPPKDKRRTEFAPWLRKPLTWLEAINCLQGQKEHGIAVYKTLQCSSIFSSCFR